MGIEHLTTVANEMTALHYRLQAAWAIMPGVGTSAIENLSLAVYWFNQYYKEGTPMAGSDNAEYAIEQAMEILKNSKTTRTEAITKIIGDDWKMIITRYQEAFPHRMSPY